MNKKMFAVLLTAVFVFLVFTFSDRFESRHGKESPTGRNNEKSNNLPSEEKYIYGEANVESIDIVFLESFPLQVRIVAKGHTRDACTDIGDVQTKRGNAGFGIAIQTIRPKDAMCAQVLKPFEKSIPLDVYGLKAGMYTVDAQGVHDTFIFTQDNILPNE